MIQQQKLMPMSAAIAQPQRARNRTTTGRRHAQFDDYAGLVAGLQARGKSGSAPVAIGITSCGRGEGVSTVSSNLAVAAQVLDQKAVLIDAHLARPSLNRIMAVPLSPGLGDYLDGMAALAECLYKSSLKHLTVLPSGTPLDGPAVHEAARVSSLLDALREGFGLILVDLPPLKEISSCLTLAGQLDGVLLVVAAERVAAEEAERAVAQFQRAGGHLLGVVLNSHRQYVPKWLS